MTSTTNLRFVTFKQLTQEHLPLIHEWLKKEPNERVQNSVFSMEAFEQQVQAILYGTITIEDETRPLKAFVMYENSEPVGYIHYYQTTTSPGQGAAISLIFKEPLSEDLDKESALLELFLDNYLFLEYKFCIVDLDSKNSSFIKLFQNLDFILHADFSDFLLMKKKGAFEEDSAPKN